MKGKCAKLTTIAIIINNGQFWIGSNYCYNPQKECPRGKLPTGEGYELCKEICDQKYHAEVDACINAGINTDGGDLYLIGHYYCCNDCKKVMKEFGIKNIYIFDKKE
jgi:deoxycytidylate deaminase